MKPDLHQLDNESLPLEEPAAFGYFAYVHDFAACEIGEVGPFCGIARFLAGDGHEAGIKLMVALGLTEDV